MPWGEMTITLDDVSALLHLPLTGTPLSPEPTLDYNECLDYGETYFGISRADSYAEYRNRTPAYRFSFLADRYRQNMAAGLFDEAARCYLLHLLGSTILTDKSHISVGAKWMKIIAHWDTIGTWSWGTACLAHLYQGLNDAVYYDTRVMAGYATLLQCWIYEHFPTICDRRVIAISPRYPRASRWDAIQLHGTFLVDFRRMIDALSIDEVIFTPYDEEVVRQHSPLHDMSFYRGWLLFGDTAVRYMPDRVMWQFRFLQQIPRPPLGDRPLRSIMLARLQSWMARAQSLRITGVHIGAGDAYVISDGYSEWYSSVARLRLTPMDEDAEPVAEAEADAEAEVDLDAELAAAEAAPVPRRRTLQERLDSASEHILSAMYYHIPDGAYDELLGALGDLDLLGD